MITIVDYGMGNIGSIKNMLKRIGVKSESTSDRKVVIHAEKLILPGVGAFDRAMMKLKEMDLIEAIQEKANNENCPVLGICLGMQLLGNGSEEGEREGLGLIPGLSKRFNMDSKYKVPHMGWNEVKFNRDSILFAGYNERPRFYFVHSYYFSCVDKENSIGTTSYGLDFTSVVQKGNIYGTQFHPEKSHKYGMQLLKNFIELS